MEEAEKTLEQEIQEFANSLPYWGKYIANKLLSGQPISVDERNEAYGYFLEDYALKDVSEKVEIDINFTGGTEDCKYDLSFVGLKNVEGVNALAEEQIIEFIPSVTLIYGVNGSGKSGYIRLLKKAFFARAEEPILQNIHCKTGHKPISAEFVFNIGKENYSLHYPDDVEKCEFRQFAVFDSKSAVVHLNKKNKFEFRPAGLRFFSDLQKEFKEIEENLESDIEKKSEEKNFSAIFDGDSEIKELVEKIGEKSKIEDLQKYTPYTEEDTKKKTEFEKKKIKLSSLRKDKEIKDLEEIKDLISTLKKAINKNNTALSKESLQALRSEITECKSKEEIARQEGVENFKSEYIKNIGGKEWKIFIEKAKDFASLQGDEAYPQDGDLCLLCHQPLSKPAQELISAYWLFIKSQAEVEAQKANTVLQAKKTKYKELNLNLLASDSVLTKWLKEKKTDLLAALTAQLDGQRQLIEDVISDIEGKEANERNDTTIDLSPLIITEENITAEIESLKEKEPSKELDNINKQITFLLHKEKLNEHISSIEEYIKKKKWVSSAQKAKKNIPKRKITDKEKELSQKYFSKTFVKAFENECKELDGDFGVKIQHSGTSGTSYRELQLAGKTPDEILSEGEQKVISLADFIVEAKLATVNRGLIFDDPVNSLDEERKSRIATRLVKESQNRQIIIFTHDLVFLSCVIGACQEMDISHECHWIESSGGVPGKVWLHNTPSYEKEYKTTKHAREYYSKAIKAAPEGRENYIKNGFSALRTSYEALVIFDLFNGVVQRFDKRISLDSLSKVYFDIETRDEICDSFYMCCRYMEGHLHSDKYAYIKPEPKDLICEIERFDNLKKKIRGLIKQK